jgi:hypothetical protein
VFHLGHRLVEVQPLVGPQASGDTDYRLPFQAGLRRLGDDAAGIEFRHEQAEGLGGGRRHRAEDLLLARPQGRGVPQDRIKLGLQPIHCAAQRGQARGNERHLRSRIPLKRLPHEGLENHGPAWLVGLLTEEQRGKILRRHGGTLARGTCLQVDPDLGFGRLQLGAQGSLVRRRQGAVEPFLQRVHQRVVGLHPQIADQPELVMQPKPRRGDEARGQGGAVIEIVGIGFLLAAITLEQHQAAGEFRQADRVLQVVVGRHLPGIGAQPRVHVFQHALARAVEQQVRRDLQQVAGRACSLLQAEGGENKSSDSNDSHCRGAPHGMRNGSPTGGRWRMVSGSGAGGHAPPELPRRCATARRSSKMPQPIT